MPERRLEIEVQLILERASRDLRKLRGNIGRTAKQTKRDVGGTMSKAFGRLALKIGAAAGAYLGFRAALRLGKDVVRTTSDLVELDSAMEVIFQKTLPGINDELSRFAEGMNRGTIEMKEATQQFGIFFRAMEFGTQESADLSVELTKLAVDFQSLVGGDINQLIQRITSSLTGESEAAKRLGANIRVDNLARIAQSIGIKENIKDVSEQTRVLLRAKELIRALSIAQGDATRTQDQFANQMRAFTTSVREASAELGIDLINSIQDAIEEYGGLELVILDTKVALGLFIDLASIGVDVLGKLASKVRSLAEEIFFLGLNLGAPLGEEADRVLKLIKSMAALSNKARADARKAAQEREPGVQGVTVGTLPFDLGTMIVNAQRGGEETGDAFAQAFATAIGLFIPAQVELMGTFEFGIAQAQKRFEEFTSAVETGFRTTVGLQSVFLSGIDDAADSIVEGEFKFKSFFQQLLKDLAKVALRTQFLNLLKGAIGGGSSGLSGLLGGLFGEATGGVVSGQHGQMPVHHYAGGGIATSPQVAVFGDRGAEAAFVPLPGANRGIPVEFGQGGGGTPGGGTVNIFVTSLDPRGASDVIMAEIGTIERGLAGRLKRGVNRGMVEAVRGAARG